MCAWFCFWVCVSQVVGLFVLRVIITRISDAKWWEVGRGFFAESDRKFGKGGMIDPPRPIPCVLVQKEGKSKQHIVTFPTDLKKRP